jgi:hypothetical protein
MSAFLTQHRACWFCLAPEGARLRIDKRGNPFLSCACCGVFAFLRTPSAFASLGLMQDVAQEYAAALHDPAHPNHREVRARVEHGRQQLRIALQSGLVPPSDQAAADLRAGTQSPDLAASLALPSSLPRAV